MNQFSIRTAVETLHNPLQYLGDDQFAASARRALVGTGRAFDQHGQAYRVVRDAGAELFVRVH